MTLAKQRVLNGSGVLKQLDAVLPNYKNVLLFNDDNGFGPCGAEEYFRYMERKLAGRVRFQFVPYAGKALPVEDVDAKYKEVKSNSGVDLVVAVGGGTVIDLAKIVAVAYSNGCGHVDEVLVDRTLQNRLETVYIPTTAGTGSEATSFAVVYKDRVKYSVDKPSLLPTYTVLDPQLLESLPVPVLNATILDALAQAIESAWACGSTGQSMIYAEDAIRLILENLEEGKSDSRLEALQMGSHLAGKAINISRTTLPHSISYPMSSHFGVPHGIAVFLTLPGVAELNYRATSEQLQPAAELARVQSAFDMFFRLFGVDTIEALIQRLNDVMVSLGIKRRLRDYGIRKGDLEFLASNALTKGRSDNNPRKVDSETVRALLEEIY